jgi:hypothetical protein
MTENPLMDIIGARATDTPALIGPWGKTSFADLRKMIDEEKRKLSGSDTALLASHSNPEFIAKLLAHLESGRPDALVSPDL